ncbi:hypothetical protein O3P69_011858 [Scylla paramamosain]|uniref:Reverse transcriptase domain-containing protein n=1 Tax=Scylla paramamosain TaxID=85552 RepID=A0AAW0SAH5_SCYPA
MYKLSTPGPKYRACPDRWKQSTVIALPKVADVTNLGQLRPVSLTHTFGKVVEGRVADVALTDKRPHIDGHQFGNLKGRSTTQYMVFLLDAILKGLEQRNTVAQMCLIDFKKAFDNVDHGVAVTPTVQPAAVISTIVHLSSRAGGGGRNTKDKTSWLPPHGVAFPDVHLDANPIPCVDIAKVVGLVMNSNLTWQDHVDHIVKKASKLFFMLFKQGRLRQHSNASAANTASVSTRSYNSYIATLTTFGLPSLEDRRGQLTLSFGEKMKENDHLQLLPQRAPSRYQTRHSARLPPVRCRTERYRNSTIPYVTRLANK